MLWEILHIALEMVNERQHLGSATGQASPRRVILIGSFITRTLLSIVDLWLIASCLVILLELYYALTFWALIGTVLILFVNIFTLIAVWKFPFQASRLLIPQSLLLIAISSIVFASLFFVVYPTPETTFAVLVDFAHGEERDSTHRLGKSLRRKLVGLR